MAQSFFYLVLVSCLVLTFCAEKDGLCTTPNGEQARCIPIHSCAVIQEAILTLNSSAVEFARNSQCGYADEPLVCCGTTGFPLPNEYPPQSHLLPNSTQCGNDIEEDKVLGGHITELHEFPWMALLGYEDKNGAHVGFKCGGSLISNRYVLTAGHCIMTSSGADLTLSVVRLGEWRISTESDCTEHVVNQECADPVLDLRVEKSIVHPQYSRRTGNNDIGLIRLEKDVKFSVFISPICLPSYYAPFRDVGTSMTIAGWGRTEYSLQSDMKLKAEVPIVASTTCKAKIGTRGEITENQVCAGGDKGRDACQGDSGGPLMGTYKDRRLFSTKWYLEGIVAWGVGCAGKEIPGIYTRVARYMMWILNNMNP